MTVAYSSVLILTCAVLAWARPAHATLPSEEARLETFAAGLGLYLDAIRDGAEATSACSYTGSDPDPRDCTRLSTREIAARCSAGREARGPISVRSEFGLKCSLPGPLGRMGMKTGLRANNGAYRVGIAPDETIDLEHTVVFTGLEKRPNDREALATRLQSALPTVRAFWADQGVNYRLNFTIRESKRRSPPDATEVRVDFKPGRSNSSHWHLGDESHRPAYLVAHELAHLLGIPDNYVDDSIRGCRSIYGSKGRNAGRPQSFRCPATRGRFCADLMGGEDDLSEMRDLTLAPDDFYSLIRPLCPGVCRFEPSRMKEVKAVASIRHPTEWQLVWLREMELQIELLHASLRRFAPRGLPVALDALRERIGERLATEGGRLELASEYVRRNGELPSSFGSTPEAQIRALAARMETLFPKLSDPTTDWAASELREQIRAKRSEIEAEFEAASPRLVQRLEGLDEWRVRRRQEIQERETDASVVGSMLWLWGDWRNP